MSEMVRHSVRKHAKLSASGAERWTKCPASVHLSEGLPDKDTIWSKEGTVAHEMLEGWLQWKLTKKASEASFAGPQEMRRHVEKTATFIHDIYRKLPGAELLIESRVHLDFIDPDMWGTYDAAIIDVFGTLHVFDFKYGAGHAVSPRENLQAIFYGLGLAHQYDWNFARVRLWIIQPRVQGFDGPAFWELSIHDLRGYVEFFRKAVRRVKEYGGPNPSFFEEGRHCHFCKAKGICPLQQQRKLAEGKKVFSAVEK